MRNESLHCPSCGSTDLEAAHLAVYGNPWHVVFRTAPFRTKELVAFACLGCDEVFFRLCRKPRENPVSPEP